MRRARGARGPHTALVREILAQVPPPRPEQAEPPARARRAARAAPPAPRQRAAFTLPAPLLEAFRHRCAAEGLAPREVVRELLAGWVERHAALSASGAAAPPGRRGRAPRRSR